MSIQFVDTTLGLLLCLYVVWFGILWHGHNELTAGLGALGGTILSVFVYSRFRPKGDISS